MRDEYPVGFGEFLREVFKYTPSTGLLEKKHKTNGVWKRVTALHPEGYYLCNVAFSGRNWVMPAQRVIFFLQEKRWPMKVSFKNGDHKDLRWENVYERSTLNEQAIMERVQVGGTSPIPITSLAPLAAEAPKAKLRPWFAEVMEGEKTSSPLSTGLFSTTLKRELNPTEAMEAVRRKNQADEDFQALQERLIMECHPVFAELTTARAAHSIQKKERLREYGLWSGCGIHDFYTFLAECNKHSLPPDSSSVVKKVYEMKMSGELASLPKWESDRWQGEVWLRAIRTGLYREWEIERFLEDYTYLGERVDAPVDTWPALQQSILENHNFATLTQAVTEAYERYTKKMSEERKKLEEFGEFS